MNDITVTQLHRTDPSIAAARRWLIVALVGLAAMAFGLAWDLARHAADPGLAAEEGPLTMANPSHALAALGVAMVAVGLGGALWALWLPTPPTTRSQKAAATAAVLAAVAVTAAVGWALGGGGEHDHTEPVAGGHDHATASGDDDGDGSSMRALPGAGHPAHPPLPGYDQRHAAASEAERAAAGSLLVEVGASLVRYADPEAAIADGYVPPPAPTGPLWYYTNRSAIGDASVLEPDQPEGLVYLTVEGEAPTLLGSFFIAPPGTEAPAPAGDLVVWHSHSTRCPQFHVTDTQPRADTVRMLHVWTAGEVELVDRRTGRTVTATFSDPFGAPFKASVTMSG